MFSGRDESGVDGRGGSVAGVCLEWFEEVTVSDRIQPTPQSQADQGLPSKRGAFESPQRPVRECSRGWSL